MVERLTITAMGKHRLADKLKDRIWAALYNLPANATDERRADAAVSAVMVEGEYQDVPDHGTWHEPGTHQ